MGRAKAGECQKLKERTRKTLKEQKSQKRCNGTRKEARKQRREEAKRQNCKDVKRQRDTDPKNPKVLGAKDPGSQTIKVPNRQKSKEPKEPRTQNPAKPKTQRPREKNSDRAIECCTIQQVSPTSGGTHGERGSMPIGAASWVWASKITDQWSLRSLYKCQFVAYSIFLKYCILKC